MQPSPLTRPLLRTHRPAGLAAIVGAVLIACGDEPSPTAGPAGVDEEPTPLVQDLDSLLQARLSINGIDGRIEETLEARLGRPVNDRLAELGRLLFFDPVLSVTEDNSCSGCHGPNVSFNDSKSISVGVDNNGVVGPGRSGPHNLRRAPTIINAAFYPKLMWDGRFAANSLDPFDNSDGFAFPDPEGDGLSHMEHLLGAQAFTPTVSRMEMAGFEFEGDNDAVRALLASRVDAIEAYRSGFADVFPDVAGGDPVSYAHIAAALAEFQFTLIRADAPVDRYARGDTEALTREQKLGGALFFERKSSCFECHITLGYANQMFSDFDNHVLAVPQIVPLESNAEYDGPAGNEDFGVERITGNPEDRYRFRTTPLRNAAFQPTFMHNGAFVCMEDAIRHHTELFASIDAFSTARLDASLQGSLGPMEPMLERAHKFSVEPRGILTDDEFRNLTDFVQNALMDPDAHPDALRHLIPDAVPSGLPVHDFEYDITPPSCN
jgi:cytochrome c peroxidase